MDINIIYSQRKEIIEENKDFLNNKLFLEFGTCHGGSMLDYYKRYSDNSINSVFYGFDSFQGLPDVSENETSVWGKGDFTTNGHINPELLNKPYMHIIDGWYKDTLTDELAGNFIYKKAGIVHMDCDIYSSTMEAWEFVIKHDLLTQGTLVVYDDWGAYRQANLTEADQWLIGEGRAHTEICDKYNLLFEDVRRDVPDSAFYEIATFRYLGSR